MLRQPVASWLRQNILSRTPVHIFFFLKLKAFFRCAFFSPFQDFDAKKKKMTGRQVGKQASKQAGEVVGK